MIRSMTGFAAVSRESPAGAVSVTLKSVNHRFLDVQVKAPASLGAIEPRVKALVQQRLTRGRVDVAIALELTEAPTLHVTLNEALLERLAAAVAGARDRGLVEGGLTVADALRVPQVLEVRHESPAQAGPPDEALALVEAAVAEALDALVVMRATEGGFLQRDLDTRLAALAALVEAAVAEALDALVVMRATEGGFLQRDLDTRLAALAALVDDLEREARLGQDGLDARLRERLALLPPDVQGDPAAVAQEIVRVVARSDIDEELVRLRGHAAHWRALSAGDEPCGRKLDFLVQEMHREVNTIGSKAEGPRAPELVVTAKAELERLKEQVQNVE